MAVGTLTVGGLTLGPTLMPVRSVRVAQAVFDGAGRAGDDAAPGAGGTSAASPALATSASRHDGERAPARGGAVVQAAGWIEPDPYAHAAAALVDGVVARVLALEGDYVERGAVVAELIGDDAKLLLRQCEAQLADAQAALAIAQAELRAAESAWASPIELERAVAAGAAALAESRAELAQLPALIEAAEATLDRLVEEHARAVASQHRGATTELEVIIARQKMAAQRAEVAAVRALQPLLGARVDRLEADLRAAERALELRIEDRRALDTARAAAQRAAAKVREVEALRDQAALQLERTVVRAPISGYVQQRLRAPGDKVAAMMDDPASSHILSMYDPERLQVRVDVPLADAGKVFVGQACQIQVEALPGRTLDGVVTRITHQADIQKNTLQAKVRVLAPVPLLRPEMLARVRFLSGAAEPAGAGGARAPVDGALPAGADRAIADGMRPHRVLVPEAALLREGSDAASVWVVVDRWGGRGVLRRLAVAEQARSDGAHRDGAQHDGWAMVVGALPPGALLAMPEPGLREGQRVAIAGAWDAAMPSSQPSGEGR